MKRTGIKKILFVFVPFLALAFTPLDFHYCFAGCEGCPMGQESRLVPQLSSQVTCCGIYHWEGLAFTNTLQKTDDPLKGKLGLALKACEPFNLLTSSPLSFERKDSSLYSNLSPPLFVLKQSFLI